MQKIIDNIAIKHDWRKNKETKIMEFVPVTQEIKLDATRGLVMRVGKKGNKVFYYYYKDFESKWRKHKIGAYDKTGVKGYWLDRAIDTADKLRLEFKDGRDPRQAKQATRKKKNLILRNFLDNKYYPHIEVEHKAHKQTKSIIEFNHQPLMNKRIDKINTMDIDKFQRNCKKGTNDRKPIGNAAINRAIGVLVTALNKAVEWDIIDTHHIGKRKKLSTVKSAGKIFTDEELAKLYSALDTRKGYFPVLIRVLLGTGMRPNEVYNLTWGNTVDFKNKQLIVSSQQSKNGRARIVPMSKVVYEALKQWKKVGKHEIFVFPSRDGTGGIVRIQKSWVKLIDDAGIDWHRIYDARHTVASRMLEKGASLKQVASILGHTNLSTTEIYLHTTEDDKRKAIDLL